MTTVPVSSPTPAGSRVMVAGPEIVLELTLIADPSAPVTNSEAVTIPEATTLVSEMLSSRLTVIVSLATEEFKLVPPETVRVSVRRLTLSDPLSPATVSAVPTEAVPAAVSLPFESTVNVGISVEEPYEPADTAVSAKVSARSTLPVPSNETAEAVASPEALKSLEVSNAVAVSALPVTSPVKSPTKPPVAVTIPVEFTEAKVTPSDVPTACPIETSPSVIETPVPPLN